MRDKNKIFGLDLLRVGAILLVLCAHTLWIYHGYSNLLTKAINFSGFLGVEFFFVLSGFLIGKSLLRMFLNPEYGHASATIFLKRRWFRIMPNYLFVLVLNLIVAYLIGMRVIQPWKYFFFLQNLYHPMLPFFPESWSMSIKELPYFFLPFIFLLMTRPVSASRRNVGFVMVVATCALLSFSTKVWYHYMAGYHTLPEWNVSLRSVALFRVDAVFGGMIASWLQYNYLGLWVRVRKPAFIVGILVLATLAILVGFVKIRIETCPFFWNVLFLPLISFAVILLLPVFSEWKAGPDRLRRPMQYLGALSYSIYLLHYSFVLYLMKYFIDTSAFPLWKLHLFTASYIVITFSLSWMLYTFYEQPLLRIREMKM